VGLWIVVEDCGLWFFRLRVVYNFGDGDCGALPSHCVSSKFRTHMYFVCPTIAITKIRDYSQSSGF